MRVQFRILSRSLVSVLGALLLIGCSRKAAPEVDIEPPPVETPPPSPQPPVVIEPAPAGPPAGSVWDVVTPDGLLPDDLLQTMAKEGADLKADDIRNWKTWSVDINDDGSKEFFISNVPGWCGSGGCSVWLWQRTPGGLRNLLPTPSILTIALELGEAGQQSYHDILYYHRAMQNGSKQSLAQVRMQWDGQAYLEQSKVFLGDYLKTALPDSAWKVMK